MPYSTSYTSRFFLLSNVKPIDTARGEFTYNFFTADERVNEKGQAAVSSERYSSSLTQEQLSDPNVSQEIPRYVRLDFNYFGHVPDFGSSIISNKDINESLISVAARGNHIIAEESLGAYDFSTMLYGNKQLEESCDSFFRKEFSKTGEQGSPAELLKMVAKNVATDSDVLASILPDSLNGMSFNSLKYSTSEKFKNEELIVDTVKLNSTFAPYMLYGPQARGNMLYNLAGVGRLQAAIQSQLQNLNAFWALDENIFNIPYYSVEKLEGSPSLTADRMDCIGFIFEKNRIFDGQRYPMKSLIIDNPRARSIIDTEVAADMIYEYKPRAVYHVKIPMKAAGQYTGWFSVEFFVASKVSAPVTVVCEEAKRPLPPATLEFSYSLEADRLRIDWRDIVNDQQDIKYFQIFRRRYVSQPFELIAELDFDDSIVRKEPDEVIDPDLIVDLDFRINFYEDASFDHDSRFIYAVVTKDARLHSSVYSAQYMVSYDLNTKTTIVQQVSDAGAPKHMPNYKMRDHDELTVPRFPANLKNSGHKSVKIIFDPECLAYTQDEGNQRVTTRLFDPLPTSNQGDADILPHSRFTFQFLDVDKLESDSLEVYVKGDPLEERKTAIERPTTQFELQRLAAIIDYEANRVQWAAKKDMLPDHAIYPYQGLLGMMTSANQTAFRFILQGFDPIDNVDGSIGPGISQGVVTDDRQLARDAFMENANTRLGGF